MELEQLFNNIRYLHEEYKGQNKIEKYGLIISSYDNYYLIITDKTDNNPSIKIRIEKEYNLVNMWSDEDKGDSVSYKITVVIGNNSFKSERSMIDLTQKIITPILRDCKLNKIL